MLSVGLQKERALLLSLFSLFRVEYIQYMREDGLKSGLVKLYVFAMKRFKITSTTIRITRTLNLKMGTHKVDKPSMNSLPNGLKSHTP